MINKAQIEDYLERVCAKMMTMKNENMQEVFPISLIDINCWEWPQGIGIFGLYKHYTITKSDETLQFLIHWFDDRIREGILEKNVNTTAPMLTLTYLYEITKKQEYLELIIEWTDWIMKDKKLIRTGDECFQHMITKNANDGEILIDTLFMAVLFLARAGKLLHRQDCIDEASYQVLAHIKYLFNKKEGLFYHGWNFNYNHNYGEVLWGRGNGWYTVVVLELCDEGVLNDTVKRYLLSVFHQQVKALAKYCDADKKLWHTVIPNTNTYIEISASAAFLYGIARGVRAGVLDKAQYQTLITDGVQEIVRYIDKDGTVNNVSYGTPIGDSEAFYENIPCCAMTYGQALMVLLLQELLQDYWQNAEQ